MVLKLEYVKFQTIYNFLFKVYFQIINHIKNNTNIFFQKIISFHNYMKQKVIANDFYDFLMYFQLENLIKSYY